MTSRGLRKGIERAAAYLSNACMATGEFNYRVFLDPAVKLKPRYNILRHAGAIYALAQYGEQRTDAVAVEAIFRAGHFLVRESLAPVEDDARLLAIWSRDGASDRQNPFVAKLGGAGLGLVALLSVERIRRATTSLATLRRLGEFVLYMQKPDGSFFSKFIPDQGGRNDDWTSLYYPGEAALGLVMLYEADPDSRWLEGARKTLSYLAQVRRGQTSTEPDHWALLATARLLQIYGSQSKGAELESIYQHALQVSRSILTNGERSQADDPTWGCLTADGRTCPTATRLEGLLATLTILRPEEQALKERISRAVERGIDFLLRAQISTGPLAGGVPKAVVRAMADDRKTRNNGHHNVRIDYVQHALSAMLHYDTLFYRSPSSTRTMLDESLRLGKRYFLNHQKPEGHFSYCYDWLKKSYSSGDNQVRQSGTVWGLTLIYQDEPDEEVAHAIEKALAFFDTHSIKMPGGERYVAYPGAQRGALGTVALMALAYIDFLRAVNGHITEAKKAAYRQRANEYLRFIVSARAPDGRFHKSYRVDNGRSFGIPSPYFDGESLLALVKAAKYLDRGDLQELARDAANVGHATNVVEPLEADPDSDITKGYYQWSSMSYFELATSGWSGTEKYGDWLIDLADWMIDVHRVLKRTRNTAYAFEGIVSAYQIASIRGDTHHEDKFLRAIETGLEKLTSWQVGHSLANEFIQQRFQTERDGHAIGGIQNHRREALLRIDVVQHQMHAVILARRYCFGDRS